VKELLKSLYICCSDHCIWYVRSL